MLEAGGSIYFLRSQPQCVANSGPWAATGIETLYVPNSGEPNVASSSDAGRHSPSLPAKDVLKHIFPS